MTALLNVLKNGSLQRGLVFLASGVILYFHPELAPQLLPSTLGTVGLLGVVNPSRVKAP